MTFCVRAAVSARCSAAVESLAPLGSAPKLVTETTPRGSVVGGAGVAAVRQGGVGPITAR